MKKLIALILVLIMVLSLAACAGKKDEPVADAPAADAPAADAPAADEPAADEPVADEPVADEPVADEVVAMTHEEYMAAAIDDEVVVEFYVQGSQGWWFDSEAGHGKVTLYLQDQEGAYFAYEVNCSEEDSAKLANGVKVRITGDKAEWAGEIEIMNGTIEVLEGDPFIAEATDVTALMGTEGLALEMNKLVTVKGMTFKSFTYKDNKQGNDIYVTLTLNDAEYSFCVESYLTGPDSDVYKAVEALKEGDVINVTGFLYWYEGPNTHITAIEAAA